VTRRRCAAAVKGLLPAVAAAAVKGLLPVVAAAAVMGLLLAAAAAGTDPVTNEARELERDTRRALENGRALLLEGRADAAERVLRRGLKRSPHDPQLERALAHVLDALERPAEARAARDRADARLPRPAPLPDSPLLATTRDWLVLLVTGTSERPDAPGTWPDDAVRARLAARIAQRLPGATFRQADPESVAEAEGLLSAHPAARVLSLRVDRVFCGFSIKDGQIAFAELRAVASIAGQAAFALPTRRLVEDPLPRAGCEFQALDRALEAAIVPLAATNPEAVPPLAEPRIRALFPGLERRVTAWIRKGRRRVSAGQLEQAEQAFEAALGVDPGDAIARAYRDDVRASRALAQELARETRASDSTSIDPRLSPSQRAAAEIALRHEQQRREELLAALAVLDEDVVRPPDTALAKLRAVEIPSPDEFGPTLARQRAGGAVDARVAYAPDGDVIARYYFPRTSQTPILREEDTRGDGKSDRWITYRGNARHEIFEDRGARGRSTGDGEPDHVLRYREGVLFAEEADTDGDGRLDRFDHFDAEGLLDVREEDLDGDGAIDVRSEYVSGKLVRREISAPEHLPES
jgi:tetratricopeptide (TPR) repeat protein